MIAKPEKYLPYVCNLDFHKDVLPWRTRKKTLCEALVDYAWDRLFYDCDPETYVYLDNLAGDLYETTIELDGPTVRLTIDERKE